LRSLARRLGYCLVPAVLWGFVREGPLLSHTVQAARNLSLEFRLCWCRQGRVLCLRLDAGTAQNSGMALSSTGQQQEQGWHAARSGVARCAVQCCLLVPRPARCLETPHQVASAILLRMLLQKAVQLFRTFFSCTTASKRLCLIVVKVVRSLVYTFSEARHRLSVR